MQNAALLSALFIFLIGLGVLLVITLFILDISQTKDAIRHNFPVIGRFRYLFSRLGEFLRQYFFAMDKAEIPFNLKRSVGQCEVCACGGAGQGSLLHIEAIFFKIRSLLFEWSGQLIFLG